MNSFPAPRHVLAALSIAAAALLAPSPGLAEEPAKGPPMPKPVYERRPIDLVLCLDTSGSMQGLINAARQKLWEVVNELALAEPTPRLRVALLTYGSPGDDATGHVVLRTDLTEDLDLVSERLFSLGTNGGDEYVGRVVKHALDRLSWSGADAAKILFVAGNESADQDRAVPFRDAVKAAAARGIRVNSIYCGNPDDDIAPGWREVALLGRGRYAAIDMNQGTVAVTTPYDKELEELSRKINATYLAYGAKGEEARLRQTAQDANAAPAPGAAAERAASKASGLYRNSSWDLVDKSDEAGFDLSKVAKDDLPEEMKAMSLEEQKAFLAKKKTERAEIQARIQELDGKRRAHVVDEMRKQGLDDGKALDKAVRDAVREQAAEKGFDFASRAPAPTPPPSPTPVPAPQPR